MTEMEEMEMQLNTARIFVDDIAAAKLFYSQSLGLPLQYDGEQYGFCLFRPGNVDLVVEVVPPDAPADGFRPNSGFQAV
jgi:catechol 2,3-dioxygenase-like lactoylglutathione lyase family enzyme